MKKFLKALIIVVLVVGAVVGAAVLFFQNRNDIKDNTVSVLGFVSEKQKVDFEKDLNEINKLINSDGLDDRFDLIVETSLNLDECYEELITYFADSDFKVNSQSITANMQAVASSRNLANSMIKEYKIKAAHTIDGKTSLFDRHKGANDLYKTMLNYLKNYANLIDSLNKNLDNVVSNKSADFKFNMIEIYTKVVINTTSQTETNTISWVKLVDADNLELLNMHDCVNFDNSYVDIAHDKFSSKVNEFNKNYQECNKDEFCNNLQENIEKIDSLDTKAKKHIIATYWFGEVFGI